MTDKIIKIVRIVFLFILSPALFSIFVLTRIFSYIKVTTKAAFMKPSPMWPVSTVPVVRQAMPSLSIDIDGEGANERVS